MAKMEQEKAVATWRAAAAVCMDVDSTVCKDEGIDKLASFCGAGFQVADWYVSLP
jgi:phosphoserine phosphatase